MSKAMKLLAMMSAWIIWPTKLVLNLPYGAQRRVEMARALATDPKILFLDEPTAGMNPDELVQMMEIHPSGTPGNWDLAIFLIEHRLQICDGALRNESRPWCSAR